LKSDLEASAFVGIILTDLCGQFAEKGLAAALCTPDQDRPIFIRSDNLIYLTVQRHDIIEPLLPNIRRDTFSRLEQRVSFKPAALPPGI
jgi:hypothetical protein